MGYKSHSMKILAVVPARGGSKGIVNKNMVLLCGKPLIDYTIQAARLSKITTILISTDSQAIVEYAMDKGVQVVKRPKSLANDSALMLPVLQHALTEVEGDFDCVMTLQPTSPLRSAQHIDEAIELFAREVDADSLVSVTRAPHNMIPESLMKLNENGHLQNFWPEDIVLRRQEKPIYYARNGAAIYITRTERLKEYIFGGTIIPYIMDVRDSVDIDEYQDLELARILINERMMHE
jgi:CMP-N,N'-diacetyllegionaminic acid synthase